MNSVFVYIRTFKTVFNHAVQHDIVKEGFNPFKGISFKRYRKERPKKRTLSREQIDSIKNFDLGKDESLKLAINLFMFSYYCRGINLVDIAHLKWSDVKENNLVYMRKKTSGSFSMSVLPQANKILELYKIYKAGNESYVFPI